MVDSDPLFLRVHSKDLHEHIAQEVGECLETGLYTDLMIRCKNGLSLHAHKLVLGAISPYLRMLLSTSDMNSGDIQSLELPDSEFSQIQRLLEVVYNGSVEATMEEMRSLILFAHSLYITIPLSDEIIQMLDLKLPPLRPLTPSSEVKQHSKNSEYSEDMNQYKRQKLDNGTHEFLCPICNSTYGNLGNFRQHMKRHENDEIFQQIKEERMAQINEMITTCFDPVTSRYTCEICKSTYPHPGNFKQHLLKHEREANGIVSSRQRTRISPATLSSSGNNNSHLSNVLHSAFADRVDHGDRNLDANIKKYECQHCGRIFKHPGNFKQHLSSHMRVAAAAAAASSGGMQLPKIKMPELPKVPVPPSSTIGIANTPPPKAVLMGKPHFLSSVSLPDAPDPPPVPSATRWKCIHCPQELYFQSREKLRQHVTINHRGPTAAGVKRPLQAPIPPNLVPTAPLSPSAIAGTYQECGICHQLFETEAQLTQHMAVHAVVKEDPDLSIASELTFRCDEPGCAQAFSKEIWVRKHKETFHGISTEKLNGGTGEFECRICKKVFSKSNKLSAHMRIHRYDAPEDHYRFPCDICGKRFTRPQHVNRHKLLHTGERPFKCKQCNKSFAREDKLRFHIAKECEFSNAEEGYDYEEVQDEEEFLQEVST